MSRFLVACLLLAACGAPATRPAPLVAHSVAAPKPKAAAPMVAVAESEAERPAWLDPDQRSRRVVTSTSITILDQIAFVGVSSVIDPISLPMLDAVASTLDGNPSIRAMEVRASGADGPTQWQRLLGEERARAIVDYLVHKGVDRVRLSSINSPTVLTPSAGFAARRPCGTATALTGAKSRKGS